jgi:hypothetical protein
MERREKAKAGNSKSAADMASAAALKKAEEPKRKSKWDQVKSLTSAKSELSSITK